MTRRIVTLKFTELPGEIDLLLVGQRLVAKYQDGVLIHAGLDRGDLVC
jgi:hypothetical protein